MQRRSYSISTVIVLSLIVSILMAESAAGGEPSKPAVHIVYTESPQDEEPESYHIRVLTSVLGSEEAAKEALIYSYKSAATGFSAKLSPEQVAELSKQPGIIQVSPSKNYQLH